MKTLIEIILALAALYSGGMWLLLLFYYFRKPDALALTDDALERHTFHLGLCAILALGFLGLMS